MVSKLEKFKSEMEGAKEIYTNELESFAKKFDAISEMTMKEQPDIDTMDFIYSFKKMNGASQEELDAIHLELYDHMDAFAKTNGIHYFCMHSVISLRR